MVAPEEEDLQERGLPVGDTEALARAADTTRARAKDVSKSIKWAHRMLWIDLTIYVVFLLSFMLAALAPFVNVAWDGHMMIRIFTKYANELEWPDPANTFADIHSVADFWSWWKGPMRAVLLGKNPFSTADPIESRPDHVDGYILSNYVVGTVRLRQQRVRLECHEDNVLKLPLRDTLCYRPELRSYEAKEDWDWPRFYSTAGNNSKFEGIDVPGQDSDSQTGTNGGTTAFPPYAGAGTVQGPPPPERAFAPSSRVYQEVVQPPPAPPPQPPPQQEVPETSGEGFAPLPVAPAPTETGGTPPIPVQPVAPAPSPDGTGGQITAPAPGPTEDGGVDGPGTGAPAPTPGTGAFAPGPAVTGDGDGVDPDLGAGDTEAPAPGTGSGTSAPAPGGDTGGAPAGGGPITGPPPPGPGEGPAGPGIETPAGGGPEPPGGTEPDGGGAPPIVEQPDPPVGGEPPAVEPDLPAGGGGGPVGGGGGGSEPAAGGDGGAPPDAGGGGDPAPDGGGTVEPPPGGDGGGGGGGGGDGGGAAGGAPPDDGGGDAGGGGAGEPQARRKLLMPRILDRPGPRGLQAVPPGTRFTMGSLRELLNAEQRQQELEDEARAPPDPGDEECKHNNKDWRFGGSVPNRTCDKIKVEKAKLLEVTPAFLYRESKELSESLYTSKTSTRLYNGGGYAHDFDVKNPQQFDEITDLLSRLAWIDAGTRLVVVEMTLYSPGTDLVAAAHFMVEVHGSGFAESRIGYEAFRLHFYKSSFLGWGRLVVELLFVILCVASFLTDLLPVINKRNSLQRSHWARNPFFWMSMLMMATTLTTIGLRIHNVIALSRFKPENIRNGSDPFGSDFAKLQGPSARVRVERSLMALLSFFVWLRIFKYTRRLPLFGTIGRTMTRAFPSIVTFIVMSTVVFVGFAQSFFLGFYVSNEGFQTMGESLVSMVRFTSGDVDYDSLARTNTVLAPFLYMLALFVLGFVWTSLLLAIVINAYYDEVNDEGLFEFDKDFRDFNLANPLLRQHKEWDDDAMTGSNGSPVLSPQDFNRFVVNPLLRFDKRVPMITMTMGEFLAAARSTTDGGYVDAGETLPLGGGAQSAAGRTTTISQPLAPIDGDNLDAKDVYGADMLPRGRQVLTDSDRILVRFGSLKGVQKVKSRDVHALYFPIDMDEHRCRVWWELHKHHLRVGDAAVRYIKQSVPQAPQQIGKLIVKTAAAPLAPLAAPLRRTNTGASHDGASIIGGSINSLRHLARRPTGTSRYTDNGSVHGGPESVHSGGASPTSANGDAHANNGRFIQRLSAGLSNLVRSDSRSRQGPSSVSQTPPANSAPNTPGATGDVDQGGETSHRSTGRRSYFRSSSRTSNDGRQSGPSTADFSRKSSGTFYEVAGGVVGLPAPSERDSGGARGLREDAAGRPPRARKTAANMAADPTGSPGAYSARTPQQSSGIGGSANTGSGPGAGTGVFELSAFSTGARTVGNNAAPTPLAAPPHTSHQHGQSSVSSISSAGDVSMDLLSGPAMSAIPEVTEPLTGHFDTTQFPSTQFPSELSGTGIGSGLGGPSVIGTNASDGRTATGGPPSTVASAMSRMSTTAADVMSPLGPRAESSRADSLMGHAPAVLARQQNGGGSDMKGASPLSETSDSRRR